jgi:hypothetical protein
MNASFRVAVASSLLLAFAAGCGTERLPAPQAPPRELPAVDVPDEPPAPGTSRVVLDANGDKAKVVEITGSATAASGGYRAVIVGVRPICTTPCVVDMPYGSHPLVLRSTTDETRQSELDLDVGAKPKVVRHTLGERRDGGPARTIAASLLLLGITAGVTGALLWGVGAGSHSDGLESTGQLVTGLGLGGIGLSIPLFIVGRPTERPGATTEWTMPGAPRPAQPTGVIGASL